MSAGAGIGWFAAHELRLAWRDWIAMMTGGRRARGVVLALVMAGFTLLLHLMALGLLHEPAAAGIAADPRTLLLVSGFGVLLGSAMLTQALESVTRAYYARADLDLILSSPASSRALFAVRAGAIALTTALLACLLASPVVNVLALLDGPRWLAAYAVLAAGAALATGLSLLITLLLFRLIGPRRTRLVAQIVAAVVGAGFVIGIQGAAILYYGEFSRLALFQHADFAAAAPGPDSPVWLPARAAMGEAGPLAAICLLGLGGFGAVVAFAASRFGRQAVAAGSAGGIDAARDRAAPGFRPVSARQALRRKEWMLLRRDPWLVSQTLMQLLYLIPPALLLWINHGGDSGALVVVVAVLVMAAGQLAGGLAWLAVSGEDAHELIATAPVAQRTVLAAKIEAVLAVIGMVLAPLVVLMALASWRMALATAVCAALATASATAVQLWFRTVSRRALFRRRQTASRAATICEALVSIMWAGTGALWAAGSPAALGPAIAALLVLGFARLIAPRNA